GLKDQLSPKPCRFLLRSLDSHNSAPPKLRIQINDEVFERALPAGNGDEAINGHPEKGKYFETVIEFPSKLLKRGDNAIQITTVSGCWFLYDSVSLEAPAGAQLVPVLERTIIEQVRAIRAMSKQASKRMQPVVLTIRHFGAPAEGAVRIEGGESVQFNLTNGVQTVEALVPAVKEKTSRKVLVDVNGRRVAERTIQLKPPRELVVYILPHSHTDIGYTEIQTAIEKKQVNNLLQGIEIARSTAGYPEGARFVWNVEVLWAADLYLHRLSETQKTAFMEAVQKGWVALNGMYLNELTGLCRPEELLRLFQYSTQLSRQCGTMIDSAMISDVPGYTWGVVPAMAQAGIKYFSVAPNYFDRIGDLLVQWENKPFYWVSPSGNEKVLVWIPFKGYAMSHVYRQMTPEFVEAFEERLDETDYPYEITYTRWSGHGDNAAPDPAICDFIKGWNAKYDSPKFIISSTSEAFRAFEKSYGSKVPDVRGDWTPYWEDGAGSSALETAMNRATAERLTQAETLWVMRGLRSYPAAEFNQAWNNALLYSEHTWGASCSVSDSENQRTKEEWTIKSGYAREADKKSRELLSRAISGASPSGGAADTIEVFNTTGWNRDDIAVVPKELSNCGEQVMDEQGRQLPSQRLCSGELAFLARGIPAFGSELYRVTAGNPPRFEGAGAHGLWLENGTLRVRVDENTGAIAELWTRGISRNLVDGSSGRGLNDYLFLEGDNLADVRTSGPPKITVKENGPLVASFLVESEAAGCRRLTREIRLCASTDNVEFIDTVDKARARLNPNPGDWHFAQKGGKESVNFAFGFNVPDGQICLDIPLGLMRPELDQIRGSCKNWFTVNRWADVSNQDFGVTWVSLDAPLIEVGELSARLLGSQANPDVWRKKIERTQTFYSWVMNNHWGTNYRAYQEGPVIFRYLIRPHCGRDLAGATRVATHCAQPLLVSRGSTSACPSLLRVQPETVSVLGLKPAEDGKGVMIRLFGAGEKTQKAKLLWGDGKVSRIWLSNTAEEQVRPAAEGIEVPACGLVTLRAEP
ncbi:MAG TPA: glycoside hydrolase family 38 C-terminal domain-containing protein, partial [Candidatus Dormibacteraeota bacterium]|nr:glycoside hydrolase family 38 C-terminal domain-containing protein [Candidatus Dormibacteraeota bacterium]